MAREEEIEDLCRCVPGIRKMKKDGSLFKVSLPLGGTRSTDMNIELPPAYPRDPPLLNLDHFIECGFVNPSGRVEHALLSNWSEDSSLGIVVRAIVDDISSWTASLPGGSSSAAGASRMLRKQVPQSFPLLERLSIAELQNLLLEEERFDAFVSSTDYGQKLHTAVEGCIQRNIAIARENQRKEGVIVDLKSQISVIRSSEYAEVREKYDKLLARYLEVNDRLDPSTLTQIMESTLVDLDEQSDNLEQLLVSGELDADKFIPEFLSLRRKLHYIELAQGSAQSEGLLATTTEHNGI